MANKSYKMLRNFKGVNRAISKRDAIDYLQTCTNMDSNLEEGMLISRKGSEIKQSSGATPNIDKFVMYRDEQFGKDVLLVYDKDATEADRKIYVYTRTINTDNSFAPHTTDSYAYGSLRFGDQLSFLVHRNGVRIGTGTAAANKAMFMGYIDRSAGSDHDAMFNDAIEFTDMFLLKQQWVQQENLLNGCKNIIYDSTRDLYYLLTYRGVEIRDTDFYIKKILDDVTSYDQDITTNTLLGGLALDGNVLYACGKVPGSTDTKIVGYDLTTDFVVLYSVSKSDPNYFRSIATDGNFVYASHQDGTDGYVAEYNMSLTSGTNRYTGSGDRELNGLTIDATYVYVVDNTNNQLVRFLIASPYTSSTYPHGSGALPQIDIVHYNGNLYWSAGNILYLTTVATFGNSQNKYQLLTGDGIRGVNFVGAIPYISTDNQNIIYFDGVTNFNEAGYIPTKFYMAAGVSLAAGTPDCTYFYAASLIDIDGQESHLMSGTAIPHTESSPEITVEVRFNIDSENFAEMTSPSTDPDEELSIWNEFRRIKKVRIYRAYNSEPHASDPTTSYTFLREIDINDPTWSEESSNKIYTFEFLDDITQEEISTVTYEESSGLPESFKPYYTNWQYGTKFEGRYYYGNVRTDELNLHEVIETPINAPDIAYQHDQNIDYFYTADGDEIRGAVQVWNRLVILKGNNTAIYNGLTKENVYSIGTSAPDSILVHNNVAYFIYGNGIWALTPSGYKRISEPVDTLLAAESSLTSVSAVHFKEKMKLWFMVPNSNSYCFNLNQETWDIYDITSGTRVPVFIGKGLDDTIFTTDSYGDRIYKENTGTNDGGAGSPIQIQVVTNDIALGDGYLDTVLTRLFLTATSTDTIPVVVYWHNRNGTNNVTKTFAAASTLSTLKMYLSSVWGQYARFSVTKNITAQVKIDAIGFEYIADPGSILQDAS